MDQRKLHLKNQGVTDVKVVECTYDWTIKNFRFLICRTGESIESPKFVAGPDNKLQWQLHLYPFGVNQQYSDKISVHFVCLNDDYDDFFRVSVGIIRNNGKASDIDSKVVRVFDTQSFGTCLFPKFLKRARLFEQTSNFAEDLLQNENNLKIRCRMWFTDGYTHSNSHQPPTALLRTDDDLETPINLEHFLGSAKFSDVTLVLDDGLKEFHAHRIILSARSRVFAAMLEQKKNRVEIVDVDAEVMEEVLRFLYTGKVNGYNVMTMAMSLFQVADKYAIDGLKKICEDSLIRGLNLTNVTEVLEVADRSGTDKLKYAALNFITTHVKELADSAKFQTDMKSVSHLLGEMLNALITKYK